MSEFRMDIPERSKIVVSRRAPVGEKLRRFFYAGHEEQIYLRNASELFQPESGGSRLISEHLEQSSPVHGVYDVSVKESKVPVTAILATYLDEKFRKSVDNENKSSLEDVKSYFEEAARIHSVATEAVIASFNYYLRNKEDFDAYFTYIKALSKTDPLL